MAIEEHIDIFKSGTVNWNAWREAHPTVAPDLGAAYLMDRDCRGMNLAHSNLTWAEFLRSDFSGANLTGADMTGADARWSKFCSADLTGADLSHVNFNETDFTSAILCGCRVYGVTAWNVKMREAKQTELIITQRHEPTITVDNLELAQFVYLLLNNEHLRNALDTITSKMVLILGRFTSERKKVLDALRDELRKHDCLPVIFDFDRPSNRDLTETVSTLAHLSKFIIADITDAKSIPQELQAIVPQLPTVPVQPIMQMSARPWGMFAGLYGYLSVLPIYRYETIGGLLESLGEKIIVPAMSKAQEIAERRRLFVTG